MILATKMIKVGVKRLFNKRSLIVVILLFLLSKKVDQA